MAATKTTSNTVLQPHLPESLDLRFSAAEKFFAKKVTLTKADFDALAAEAQVLAFTVARIQSIELITDIQAEVQRAIVDGTSLADFKKAAGKLLAKHGHAGLTPWHTETVFRTNVQMAYGLGQMESLLEVQEAFPFWRYVAINDSRTRPSHRALNGRIYPANHPFWKTHFPPWGYNCRCDVIPLLPDQVKRRDKVWNDEGPPEEGFHGPGHLIDTIKNATAQELAQQFMPRIDPRAASALMRKLDTDQPVGLKVEGMPDGGRISVPYIDKPEPLPPVMLKPGPTDKEIADAWAENETFDKKAKRAAQIKAAQAKYAAKKKAEKAAATAANSAAAKAQKEAAEKLAAEIENAHGEAIIEEAKRKAAREAAEKAAKIANVKKTYPNITKDLPDDVIDKYLVGLSDAELAAKEAANIAHRKAYVLGALSKEEIARLTPEEKKLRREDQIRRSREAAKARAAAQRAARRLSPLSERAVAPTAAPVDDVDPLRRLSALDYRTSGTHGVPLRRDGTQIEGHAVNVRIVEAQNGQQFYEIYGKTANDDLAELARSGRDWEAGGPRMLRPSTQTDHIFREGRGRLTPFHTEGQAEQLGNDRVRRIGNTELRVNADRWYQDIAQRGGDATVSRTFVVRIPRTGDDAADFAALERIVKGTPLEKMLEPASVTEGRRVGIIRRIVESFPHIAQPGGVTMKLRGQQVNVRATHLWKMSETELLDFAKENGIKAKFNTIAIRDMPRTGYTTHTIERDFDYENVRLFHGTKGDGKYVAEMIAKGSVQASYHRARAGYGGLTRADDRTGGSDSLFTRIFNRNAVKGGDRDYERKGPRFTDHGFHGNYQFVWKAKELERLDIYAYNADRYGRTYGFSAPERHTIDNMGKLTKHNTQNELMVRYGIDFTNLDYVACQTESARQSLLAELRRKGITQINGRAIDEVVKVRTYLAETWS